MPYVYLARCADDSLYAGSCVNLEEREQTHNDGKGAKYTRSRLPVSVVYSEECDDWSSALKREAEIKKLTRDQKLQLIDD